MTKNIEIDLDSIPHPKDCYPVPVGATIPEHTPVWVAKKYGRLEWLGNGYENRVTVGGSDTVHLTAEPIINHPTSEDSPIAFEHRRPDSSELVVATWSDESRSWVFVDRAGNPISHSGNMITDWSPAIITKSGRGVWDERDKRDRRTKGGYKLAWSEERQMWVLKTDWRRYYGTLDAVRRLNGDAFLTGFADDKGGEE